jgi:hypothetical protein
MKKLLIILIISLIGQSMSGQSPKIIGTTNDGSRELPFGMYYGFERSATIYTKSEIGTFCFITSLGWKVQAGNQESCPTKIYLKLTTLSALSATTWNDMKTGATLVYDATTSFPATGWQTINIADFTYYSAISSTNLLVLCETNYGANPPSNYPWFWYSLTGTKQHEFWQNNDSTQLGNGLPDKLRPDIQITYLPISAHNPPSGFMATVVSTSQIDLAWIKNSANDNVMIAYNTTNTFGTPSGVYVPGNSITGGGTVIYNGAGTSWNQITELSPATTYYYMAWSVYSSPPSYSSGTVASATTLCEVTGAFPYITDFETDIFPPTCWSLSGKPWTRSVSASGYGNGSASAKADFFNITVGNFNLISPGLDLSSMTAPYVKFDHAYATNINEVDRLELWYSTDHDTTFTLLYTWLGGISGPLNTGGATTSVFTPAPTQWATKSHVLPAGTTNIMLRGVTAHGNNLYLDNIDIYDNEEFVIWNGSISSAWNNPLNWTPNVIPNNFQVVTIPQGMAHNPTVNATGLTCKQLTINSGAALTVSSTSEITVNGNMTIQMGASLNNMGMVTLKGNFDNQN